MATTRGGTAMSSRPTKRGTGNTAKPRKASKRTAPPAKAGGTGKPKSANAAKPKPGIRLPANAERVLCGRSIRDEKTYPKAARDRAWRAYLKSLIETEDPADRAHATELIDRMDFRILAAAQDLPKRFSRPRLYPRSQLVTLTGSNGRTITVGIDSMFDAAAQAGTRIQRDWGVELGWGNFARAGEQRLAAIGRLTTIVGEHGVRDALRSKTTQAMTPDERRLSEEADRLLAQGRRGHR